MLNSSATYTTGSVPAKSTTGIEASVRLSRRDQLASLGARLAFIATSVLISVPNPVSPLWGGSAEGSRWRGLVVAGLWLGLALVFDRSAGRAGTNRARSQTWSGLALLTDVAALSVLLSLSGAAQNPFTLLYFVPITLATVLARAWTWRVVLLSVAMFAVLLAQTAAELAPHRGHAHHEHFFQHVQGMAIALAVAGAFIVFFVLRIARALAAQRREIRDLSRAEQEGRFAVALGALSAGAAHELGSPLGTLQLLSEELTHLDSEGRDEAARTMREEVQRMKQILHGMQSSELSADALAGVDPWSLADLEDHLAQVAEPEPAWAVELNAPVLTTQPPQILQQILRELLRNAQQARPNSPIRVDLASDSNALCLRVTDDGCGMTAEEAAEASAPFVSHRGSTGMGLFLASVHARQLGGRLEVRSLNGAGTVAELRLPIRSSLNLASTTLAQGVGT